MNRLKLRPAPVAGDKPAGLYRLAMVAIYLAGLLGAVLCWMLEYNIPHIPAALLGAGMGAAVFIAAFFLPRGPRRVLVGAGAGIWAAAAILLRGYVARGALFAANLVYSRFTEVFVDFQTVLPPDNPAGQAAFPVFLLLAGFLLAALLAGTVLGLRSLLLTLLLTLPFFWFAFANTGLPPFVPTLLLICCWCGLLFRRGGKTKAGGKLRMAAMALCGLFVVGIVAAFPAAQYKEKPQVVKVRDDLKSIHWQNALPGFGATYLAGRSSTRVNLSGAGNLEMRQGAAFSVRGDIYNGMYLRGFSCSEYTGRAWRQGDAEAYGQVQSAFSPFDYGGLATFEQIYKDAFTPPYGLALSYETYRPAISVHPESDLPYSPAPYNVVDAKTGGGEMEWVRDAYLEPSQERAEYEVSFIFAMDGFSQSNQPFFPNEIWIPNPELSEEEWATLFDGSYVGPADDFFVMREVTLEEVVTKEELAYIEFIEEAYTRLPGGLDGTLRGLAGEAGIRPAGSYEDWHFTASQVGRYIRRMGEYTRSPGNQPVGADFVEYFVTQSQRGYCVHFASAGAAMLRALGVPARYVEGFVLTMEKDNFYSTHENWVEVPNANAHAWVEVWEPGIGWVPLEVTPGGADYTHPQAPEPVTTETVAGREPISDVSLSADDVQPDSSQAAQAGEGSSSSDAGGNRPDGGGSAEDAQKLELPGGVRLALLWAGAVAAAFAALRLVLGGIRRHRAGRFAAGDTNRAGLEIYWYLLKLEAFGLPVGEQAYELACKAKFSPHILTEEERGALLAMAEQARRQALDALPLPKKLWFLLRGL